MPLSANPSLWEKEDATVTKIYSLNCRSLKKHHQDILSDSILLKADIILLQETWLEDDDPLEELDIPSYSLNSNSCGRGKGVAIYFKEHLFTPNVKETYRNIQYSNVISSILNIATIYRSQDGSFKMLSQLIEIYTDKNTRHLIVGDLNFCYHGNEGKPLRTSLEKLNFTQIIQEPTHIEGNLLDHAYVRTLNSQLKFKSELHSKYYTDHKGIAVMIRKVSICCMYLFTNIHIFI